MCVQREYGYTHKGLPLCFIRRIFKLRKKYRNTKPFKILYICTVNCILLILEIFSLPMKAAAFISSAKQVSLFSTDLMLKGKRELGG